MANDSKGKPLSVGDSVSYRLQEVEWPAPVNAKVTAISGNMVTIAAPACTGTIPASGCTKV